MSTESRVRQVAAALIRRGNEILLVQQQGPHDPFPTWALPGGVAEPGELLSETLARELREETGLVILEMGRHTLFRPAGRPGGRQPVSSLRIRGRTVGRPAPTR